jgi:AraC family transcriptional regulator
MDADVEVMIVAIEPDRFTLAAAEDAVPDAQLSRRLVGYDATLFELGGLLAVESAGQRLNGPLFWNDIASRFVDRLVDRHASPAKQRRQRRLGKQALERVREYVMDHLDETIDVKARTGRDCGAYRLRRPEPFVTGVRRVHGLPLTCLRA